MRQEISPQHVQWHGGVWEAAIKSTKQHLIKVAGNRILNYEDMATVFVSIEACLNSRHCQKIQIIEER